MAAKRKFTVAPLSEDEEENGISKLGGMNTFKKYKQTEAEENGENSKENVQQQAEPSKQQELQDQSQPQPQQGDFSTRKAPVATNQVGKNFRETFAYLKNTDLFVLPPIPEPKKTTPKNTNSIIVNSRQRGNPILKQIRNIPWEYGDIVPDYQIGQTSCALFLSMRYHSLNPDYIHERLKKLGNMYDLRVLLVLIDVVNCKPSLKELARVAMYSNCTLILSWSPEEAGRYLETFKSYEHKPPDILQQRVESDHPSKIQDLLTTIKSVNKTDVITLMSTFGSLRNIVNATKQEMSDCPGFGSQKATRLCNAFSEPFKRAHSSSESILKGLTPKKIKQVVESNTELPADCQLKKPESSQPDTETRSKKNKNTVSENSGKSTKDNGGSLDKPVVERGNVVGKSSTDELSTCLSSREGVESGSTNLVTNKPSNPIEALSSKPTDGLSKSEAIQQFMKQKTTGTKQIHKPDPSTARIKDSTTTTTTKTTKSKQSTATITSRLRNDLIKRASTVKKSTPIANTSPITNTSSSGNQATKGVTSTQLTQEEWDDLVADSDDNSDNDEN